LYARGLTGAPRAKPRRIAAEKALPFEPLIPNGETIEARKKKGIGYGVKALRAFVSLFRCSDLACSTSAMLGRQLCSQKV
jgi:hypothetical protein